MKKDYYPYAKRVLDKLDKLELGQSIDKKELILTIWPEYNEWNNLNFNSALSKARKLTDKKFTCKNGLITRVSETKNHTGNQRVRVKCIETGEIIESISELAGRYNYQPGHVSSYYIDGKRKLRGLTYEKILNQ